MLSSMSLTPGQGIDFDALARILLVLVGVYVLSSLFAWRQAYIMAGVTQRTVYRLRADVDAKLGRLPLKTFDGRPRGDLLSRVTNDIDNIGQSLQQSLTQLITSLLTIVGVLIMMFTISPILAVISLLAVPASFAVTVLIISRSQRQFVAQWASTGALNGHVEEMHTGHAIVKVFGRQREAIETFEAENERLYQASFKAQFISGIIQPAMNFIANLNYVAIAVIGGLQVASGQMSLGDVVAFIQYSRQFTFPIIQVASIVNVLQSAVASAERVFELLDEPEEVPDPIAPATLPRVAGAVAFHDVSFRYDAGAAADRAPRPRRRGRAHGRHRRADRGRQDDARQSADALLRDRRGQDHGRRRRHPRDDARRAAPHVRDGPPGHVAVPRHDPREHRLRATRRHRGRDPGGRRGGPRRPLRADLAGRLRHRHRRRRDHSLGRREAAAHDRPSVPGRPPILILDEATSSVDTRTEVLIQRAMGRLRAGKTAFVIAHRLSTIRDADTILVMDHGAIVEQGDHDALLARGGFYAELYESQFAEPLAEAV